MENLALFEHADDDGLKGPSEQYTPAMDQALDSASRFTDLSVDRTLCSHGGFVEEGDESIREIVDTVH